MTELQKLQALNSEIWDAAFVLFGVLVVYWVVGSIGLAYMRRQGGAVPRSAPGLATETSASDTQPSRSSSTDSPLLFPVHWTSGSSWSGDSSTSSCDSSSSDGGSCGGGE